MPLGELPLQERQAKLRQAMATTALEKGELLSQENSHDLEANLYTLTGTIPGFFDGKQTHDRLLQQYRSPRQMPPAVKKDFYTAKENIIAFNHTLHETINVGASTYDFDSLLNFMTTIHAASQPETAKKFHDYARNALIGIRNEMAYEQVLIAGGVEYEVGSLEQDTRGGDFVIGDGVHIDVKSSQFAVDEARKKAICEHRNPRTIMWSHIDFEDFNGKLTLTPERASEIYPKIEHDLDNALHS